MPVEQSKLTYLFKIAPEIELSEYDNPDEKDICVRLNQEYLDLTLRSNGKMELYFHAYFWTSYIHYFAPASMSEEIRTNPTVIYLTKFATKPKQVLEMVKKYKFGEEDYKRFI